ncbi:MAG: hypothetical protein H0X24_10500 [Ktedonobacterales bacterium]|nr:hypothetical protein [Ktedonobacterales bacterium]
MKNNPSLTDTTLITTTTFERNRRLAATRSIALIFGILLTLLTGVFAGFVIIGNSITVDTFAISITFLMLFVCIGLYGTGYAMAQRGRLQTSVITTLVGALISIILITIFWKLLLGRGIGNVLIALLASSTVGIVLAGALGETWMIFATTVIMNGLAIILIGFDATTNGELLLSLAVIISVQLALAAITLATARNYRQTLNELGTAYAEVQGLDALKDQFITNINHELRTPIMTLQGYIELLRISGSELAANEGKEIIERASRASQNLGTLMASILDNRRLDQGATDFTPVPVPLLETLNNALALLDPRERGIGMHELQIRIPNSWMIMGDTERLKQIYLNLISNAIKYSPENTPIQITARLLPTRSAQGRWTTQASKTPQIEICVRDYGLGIPPEQIPLLFHRFARLPRDLASNIIGNGLGLHLVRVLAQAMNGSITVESTGIEGEGSLFRLVLPAAMPIAAHEDETTDPRLHTIVMGVHEKG